MLTETKNLPQFEAVRDSDEQILWTGKPVLIPFILSGIPFLIMGLIWGILDMSFFGVFSRNQLMGEMSTFINIFFNNPYVPLLGQYPESAPAVSGL